MNIAHMTRILDAGTDASATMPIIMIMLASLKMHSAESEYSSAIMKISKNPGSSLKNSKSPLSNSPILTTSAR